MSFLNCQCIDVWFGSDRSIVEGVEGAIALFKLQLALEERLQS
jgi:hypothetical protein